ncbi:hypothetical protein E2C01_070876 [Portunus trituberculatus]|uniref:Uncharacterized protein n=1 Tax=Portunus trituberculatus TaxID=210409 RepID=A0A5B7I2I1_PORTR|nr:hypothetical protein [Portunus trituberculatus]
MFTPLHISHHNSTRSPRHLGLIRLLWSDTQTNMSHSCFHASVYRLMTHPFLTLFYWRGSWDTSHHGTALAVYTHTPLCQPIGDTCNGTTWTFVWHPSDLKLMCELACGAETWKRHWCVSVEQMVVHGGDTGGLCVTDSVAGTLTVLPVCVHVTYMWHCFPKY